MLRAILNQWSVVSGQSSVARDRDEQGLAGEGGQAIQHVEEGEGDERRAREMAEEFGGVPGRFARRKTYLRGGTADSFAPKESLSKGFMRYSSAPDSMAFCI